VKGGNINLARAQELIPGTTEITAENAGDLVSRAGVTVRAKAECEQKFTEMLMAESSGIQRKEIIEKARVVRKDSNGDSPSPDYPEGEGTDPETPDNGGGGGVTPPGGNTGNDD
ncbi:MAG: hypothetical protein IJQ05_00150, partial [Bacteroidaceae bacterium]|nr:hypothetical protein [Bacteroidaceae bacterium]